MAIAMGFLESYHNLSQLEQTKRDRCRYHTYFVTYSLDLSPLLKVMN